MSKYVQCTSNDNIRKFGLYGADDHCTEASYRGDANRYGKRIHVFMPAIYHLFKGIQEEAKRDFASIHTYSQTSL